MGGGEVLVPLSKVMFGFTAFQASPLCQSLIFIGCLTRFLINYSSSIGKIEYNLVMILSPAVFMGSAIGHVLHRLMSTGMISVMLVVVIAACVIKMIH